MTTQLELPYPPSVNHYWVRTPHGYVIGAKGKIFRAEVYARCLEQLKRPILMVGRLSVEILAHPPDKRARDLDNLLKATLDALEHAGLYESDNQIDAICIKRQPQCKGGKLLVSVEVQ